MVASFIFVVVIVVVVVLFGGDGPVYPNMQG